MALNMPSDGAMVGAAGIVGLAVWELSKAYSRFAPSMGDMRDADCDSTEARQKVLDADVCVGGLAVIAGGAASWFAKSWVPLLIAVVAMCWVSHCHRAVLNGLTPNQIDGGK